MRDSPWHGLNAPQELCPPTLPTLMSLRFRLICLIATVLAVSLAAEGIIVFFNASRSVQTEMNSALHVGEQIIRGALAHLQESADPSHTLEDLVARFKGNRHVRVSLTGEAAATAKPSSEASRLGAVPAWFSRLLGIAPIALSLPVAFAGRDYGIITIKTDPSNEILEVWNNLVGSLLTLVLFFGLSILLTYCFIGRALGPLDRLAAALERIGHGDFQVRIDGNLVPEVAQLQRSFNRMALELKAADEEKRRLNERLLTLQEEERAEIARDLHDEVSPFLFAVNADLVAISRLAGSGRSAEIAGQIGSTLDAICHMQHQIKTILQRLRPGVLEDFGLSTAIRSIVDFWQRRRPDICFHLRLPTDQTSFGPLIDKTVYRIVQEALSNAVRHGKPAEISVTVMPASINDSGTEYITVGVKNDGAQPNDAAALGFGLTGMRERVQALGGQLGFAREPELGLSVTATIPLTEQSGRSCSTPIAGSV